MSKIGLELEYKKEVKEKDVQHYMTKYFFFCCFTCFIILFVNVCNRNFTCSGHARVEYSLFEKNYLDPLKFLLLNINIHQEETDNQQHSLITIAFIIIIFFFFASIFLFFVTDVNVILSWSKLTTLNKRCSWY